MTSSVLYGSKLTFADCLGGLDVVASAMPEPDAETGAGVVGGGSGGGGGGGGGGSGGGGGGRLPKRSPKRPSSNLSTKSTAHP